MCVIGFCPLPLLSKKKQKFLMEHGFNGSNGFKHGLLLPNRNGAFTENLLT